MPRRDTMHLPNSRSLTLLIALFFLSIGTGAQEKTRPNPASTNPGQPASSSAAQTSGQTIPSPARPQGQAPAPAPPETEPGGFVFHAEVDEVVLHATVVDDKQHLITNLEKNAFTVFENGQPQPITHFRHEDVPVAMGIVIDNSGSMREKRDKVNKAALNLVRSSNPQDQVFIVNFNDEYYLDQDFTSDTSKLREALEKVEARGGTALYDAVVASADHLKKNAKLQKKVLFVVTDGERSEEHTSELQSPCNLVCRLLLEKKKKHTNK